MRGWQLPRSQRMRILITCGPSYEPIDEARRLSNFSTGRLGVTLANCFTDLGWEIWCLKGEGATYPEPLRAKRSAAFDTNTHLAELLEQWSRTARFDAVLHAAALCDYRVASVTSAQGQPLQSRKYESRQGDLLVRLTPALKVLPLLRGWFPQARLVGWKYELAGTQAEAFAKAWRQLDECKNDACVLNGTAYGRGFAFCQRGGAIQTCSDLSALADTLHEWLETP